MKSGCVHVHIHDCYHSNSCRSLNYLHPWKSEVLAAAVWAGFKPPQETGFRVRLDWQPREARKGMASKHMLTPLPDPATGRAPLVQSVEWFIPEMKTREGLPYSQQHRRQTLKHWSTVLSLCFYMTQATTQREKWEWRIIAEIGNVCFCFICGRS